MTAPLFLLAPGSLDGITAGGSVVVDGAEGRHAAGSLRLQPGEDVLLSDGSGLQVQGTVHQVGSGELTVSVTSVCRTEAPDPRFVLIQALAKGDRDDQAIEAATELGVDEVVPWGAARSIVQWRGDRAAKAHRKWQQVVTAATKQSRRTRTPVVGEHVTSRQLASRVAAATCALVLHEDATTSVNEVELPAAGEVLVVVGPEGGISPDELATLAEAGAHVVRLGPHVLRSSSAGPAALAVLLARARW
ncbi:16S rRNA (uracil(1498)-N(3))-methyltransferase [Arsenicicoccus dermatophilus]|uniref:16S rRNA (uracil(1498)-N(3))-methyltransferase n=1 Tax=Arsenicicoccus dermatophilus TaxID=1076331 RepID=UPI001F4D2AEE|nr:16S rRNA (uracil(1498)-N(3))-methyltransferase [Arsenicicoccus dermatophilus]MCH8612800.1 16S rRNA (uracil(1498)-N(3))-methyltransferase [Arsenicicoccus dermatophilus]